MLRRITAHDPVNREVDVAHADSERPAGVGRILTAVTTATAKPPELPVDPHVQGRELSPIAREFYEPDVPPVSLEALRAVPVRPQPRPVEGMSLADVVSEMQEAAFDRITFPLGAVPVSEKK